ncbi:MAG: hypothetical protein HY335_06855 [Deinococcus sp.]|nr:hypothetical protein [Deinococcus sp.]
MTLVPAEPQGTPGTYLCTLYTSAFTFRPFLVRARDRVFQAGEELAELLASAIYIDKNGVVAKNTEYRGNKCRKPAGD